MKVGVIAAEMEGPSTGVGRYLQGLLTGLGSWDHDVEWHMFFQGAAGTVSVPLPDCVLHFSNDHGNRLIWEHLRLPSQLDRHDLDVVFCPAYTVPFGVRTPLAVCLHDLSFEVLPGDFSPRERWRRRFVARRAARVADRVMTDTEHMADLVMRRYRVPEERMAVVPLGVDRARFSPQPGNDDSEQLERLGVRTPYLLWLGTVLERRRPREVLEAFASLRSGGHDLQFVIAGANRMRSPHRLDVWIRELGLETSTLQLGYVEETSLAPLYRGAAAAVYVSQHEGFGLPPLECLACGTPVVVSGGLALDTAWPDYPFRCTHTSAQAIGDALRTIVTSTEWSGELAARAREVVDTFDWTASSRFLVAELQRAAAR
ncbi:MAG: glycosyltransferase family 1 protein [Acidobacteriota bacterium]|nr:glycosyltransferase family 1 protein [Acidobacteriota bacterium]